MKTIKLLLIGFIAAVTLHSCKKDDDLVDVPPPVANEVEVITTLQLHLTDSANSSNTYMFTFRDPDGDGGVSYDIFDTIRIPSGKTYYADIVLLNETESPADTISNEVLEEANDHLFCFGPSGVGTTITITDMDGNSLPVGLQSKWRTTTVANGTVQITLKHQPGVKDGSCSPGDTDIDVTFQMEVQ